MSDSRARPWIIMALIFLLGAITGSLLTIGFGSHFAPAPLGPQEMRNHWMHHLTNRLHLTDDQQAKIQPIIAEAETQIQSVHRDDVAKISGFMQQADENIKKVLNPDQLAEMEKMESERQRMFNGHMHGRGPGPDGDFRHPGPDDNPPGPSADSQPAAPRS